MAIEFKGKKVFLTILLIVVSTVLGLVKLFSVKGNNNTNQAQAQCWTILGPGSSSSGSSSTGCSACSGSGVGCSVCGCSSCSCNGSGCTSCVSCASCL